MNSYYGDPEAGPELNRRYFLSGIDKIYKKYEALSKTDEKPEVVDISTFQIVDSENKNGEIKYWCKEDEDEDGISLDEYSASEDEDYVDSSYNDERCSSSLASSNYNEREVDNEIHSPKLPASHYKPLKQDHKEEKKGTLVKLENPEVFKHILRQAGKEKHRTERKNELQHRLQIDSSSDEMVDIKSKHKNMFNYTKYRHDVESDPKLSKNSNLLKSDSVTGRKLSTYESFNSKLGRSYSLSRPLPTTKYPDEVNYRSDLFPSRNRSLNTSDDCGDLDISFLEEPDVEIDDGRSKQYSTNVCSSESNCSFETDSLDSPTTRVSAMKLLQEKKPDTFRIPKSKLSRNFSSALPYPKPFKKNV